MATGTLLEGVQRALRPPGTARMGRPRFYPPQKKGRQGCLAAWGLSASGERLVAGARGLGLADFLCSIAQLVRLLDECLLLGRILLEVGFEAE